jgi:hypothetical protein
VRLLPSSARKRRRLGRLAVVVVGGGLIALLVAFIPGGHGLPNIFSNEPVQTVHTPKPVPLSHADAREIAKTLDRFVPAAVGRHHPLQALPLAANELRRGTTPADWARGDIPVTPYPVRKGPTHSWYLLDSFGNFVDLELGLEPTPGAKVGNAVFNVRMRREHGQWRVAQFVLRAVYPMAH